eukprot:m.111263 g.111263  ORF g.111263 m.111263 type:complete len:496 (-) comp13437_c0_seq6:5079-6566(-)
MAAVLVLLVTLAVFGIGGATTPLQPHTSKSVDASLNELLALPLALLPFGLAGAEETMRRALKMRLGAAAKEQAGKLRGEALSNESQDEARPPIVFVPGLTSSNLMYKLTNAPTLLGCEETTGWDVLYPTPAINSTHDFLCYLQNVHTQFDWATNTFGNRKGEETDTVDFGTLRGTALNGYVLPGFEKQGWVENQTFFGAPFDWRLPGFAMTTFHTRMTQLIERAYSLNNNTRVVLIAASYGPEATLSFLHTKSQAWKDKYLSLFVAMSPLWSGANIAMAGFTSGIPTDPANPQSAALFVREVSQGLACLPWMFPRAGNTNTTWSKDEPIIVTPTKNYTAYDAIELVKDLGFYLKVPEVNFTLNDADLGVAGFKAPGVDTFVTYGTEVPTPVQFMYNESFVANAANVPPLFVANISVSGDSFVPVRSSLRGWYEWKTPQVESGHRLIYKAYANQVHASCISPQFDPVCFQEVVDLILKNTIPSGAQYVGPNEKDSF